MNPGKDVKHNTAEIRQTKASDALKVVSDGGIFIPPSADPAVAGAIWNNSGTLAISAG